MKIALFGNCQMSPIRKILLALDPAIEIRPLPSIYQLTDVHINQVEDAINESEWIVSQFAPKLANFPLLRTDLLREKYGDKVIIYPNLYFHGYGPDIGTLPAPLFENFKGPLLDYHSDKVLLGFYYGWTVEKTAGLFHEITPIDDLYGNVFDASLNELKHRETFCDVKITGLIEENVAKKRLFYVMNHPSSFLLSSVARQILALMGRDGPDQMVPEHYLHETELSAAIHPTNRFIRRQHKIEFLEEGFFKGREMEPVKGKMVQAPTDVVKLYTPEAMVEKFFSFYGCHREQILGHARTKSIVERSKGILAANGDI
ncbi:MAG: WcbI family polysaccharide biosynthesis putative acetyltransferase [Methylovulum sp.]|nr:WcbI family polysaccharide biosynthesis putative acetyltransferase [Methylovulum sp.]